MSYRTDKDIPRITTISYELAIRHSMHRHHADLVTEFDLWDYPLADVANIEGDRFELRLALIEMRAFEANRTFKLDDEGIIVRTHSKKLGVRVRTLNDEGRVVTVESLTVGDTLLKVLEFEYHDNGYISSMRNIKGGGRAIYHYDDDFKLLKITPELCQDCHSPIYIPRKTPRHLKSV